MPLGRALAALAFAVSFTATSAYADIAPLPIPSVVPNQPGTFECPRGSLSTLAELGLPIPYCAESRCASDESCADGRVCSPAPIGVCVIETDTSSGAPRRSVVSSGCSAARACSDEDATCELDRRCVRVEQTAPTPEIAEAAPPEEPAADAPTADAPSSGCGCRVIPARETPLTLGLLALVLGRRRPRRH